MKKWPFVLLLALVAAGAFVSISIKIEGIVPVAEIYNRSDQLIGYVLEIDRAHRFPNGEVKEGWLVLMVAPEGEPFWSPKLTNAVVVFTR